MGHLPGQVPGCIFRSCQDFLRDGGRELTLISLTQRRQGAEGAKGKAGRAEGRGRRAERENGNIEHRTLNIEHRMLNIEHRMPEVGADSPAFT